MITAAVCVGFRPRNEHDERVWDWCRRRWEALHPEWPVLVADSGHEKYNRSASHNAAAKRADGVDVLIFCNSDTVCYQANDVRLAVESAASGTWVLSDRYFETSQAYWSVVQHENPGDELPDPMSGYDRFLPDSCAGPQVMSAEAFAEVGGWDEGFTAWGWGDRALMDALDVLTGPHAKIGTTVHIYHPRGVAESPGANGAMRQRWATKYVRAKRRGPDAMRELLATIKSDLTR